MIENSFTLFNELIKTYLASQECKTALFEKIMYIQVLDKFKGCILGLAICDALEFPVEFVKSRQDILNRYVTTYHEYL